MTTCHSNKSKLINTIFGVGIFISTLILYLITSYPTVAYIDSGELALVCQTLGIAHPTGYPLYTLAGRLFSILPFELMTSMNLFAACSTSMAIVFIYLIAGIIIDSKTILANLMSALAALTIATAPLIWAQGITNEVYSLNLLLYSILLYLLFQSYSSQRFILLSFLLALSLGNHLTAILILPLVVVYVIQHKLFTLRIGTLFRGFLCALLGLTIYLYLPIRALQQPLFNWGSPVNLENFLRHVSGWQYQVWMFERGGAELISELNAFAILLFKQFHLFLLPLILFGIYFGLRKSWKLAIYPLLLLPLNIFHSLNFSIPDIENYLLPSILSLGLFLLFTLKFAITKKIYSYLVISILALAIVISTVHNWERQDQSGNYAALDGVHAYYQSTEENALILSANWDYVSPWYYSHFYLQERPDLLIIDTELIRRSWYFDFIRQADSALYQYIKPEIDRFLPHVKLFESEADYNQKEIESSYQAILKKLTTYPDKTIYFDQSVKIDFPLDGDVTVSGQLFRLVRAGEKFPDQKREIQVLRFGKDEKLLTERERWRLSLFQEMKMLNRKVNQN